VVVISNLSEQNPEFGCVGHMKVLWNVIPRSLTILNFSNEFDDPF
jgi:hypothetical protein